ncbi:hypothetical protein KAM621c_24320 [Citrobacter braakii]|uniref:Uncharacterized protein n=1 Tax=Citrobacter braakii TaxID=57706 RepID=A0AAD1P3C9_CITBR|nr:hypothetical protein KAM621c_24320 [Citrobacter braakii]HEE0062730.1 hypothetical protein [Citrobacter braakii]HEE9823239.1 hypothetical protein [Citrobacter braakii]
MTQALSINETIYRLANHIAGAKGGMPEEWQPWAEEIETDLRALLAAHEQEPVAWTDADELRDAKQGGSGYLFEIGGDSNKFADPLRQILLHTHPAPSIPAAVPEEMTSDYAWGKLGISAEDCSAWADGWNARAAMLQSEPVKGEL